jgi:hypothetical protein
MKSGLFSMCEVASLNMNLQQKRMMELTGANYSVISRINYSLLMQSFGCSL